VSGYRIGGSYSCFWVPVNLLSVGCVNL